MSRVPKAARRMRPASVRRLRFVPGTLALEARELLTSAGVPFAPTNNEQYMLQLLNQARANPAAEGARLLAMVEADPTIAAAVEASGENLSTFLATISAIPAEAPLAFNTGLIEAATDHDSTMIAENAQVHSPSGYLTNPAVATAANGQAYYPVGTAAWATGENIFAYSANVQATSLQSYADYFHAAFLLDWGNPSFDHLENILAPSPSQATSGGHVPFSEIGIGLASGTPTTPPQPDPSHPQNDGMNVGPVVVTEEFGWRSGNADLTGVVYQDRAGTGFYEPTGEGYGGATVQAIGQGGQGTFQTQTWGSGGYTLTLPPGTYTVSVSGGGIPYPEATTVSIGSDNVEWDAVYAAGPQADVPVPADYDGDGRTDIALYRPTTGQWIIQRSTAGPEVVQLGAPGDIPVPADYDGDGKADIAVYRPSTGQWIIQQSTAGPEVITFGAPGDIPVPADYFGDGKTDLALYRPSTGQWLIYEPGVKSEVVSFGQPGVDIPEPADYDGDGKTDLAVYRPTTGQWFILRSTAGPEVVSFGEPGVDIPKPADYDGDGKADLALYRPTTGQWFILRSTAGPEILTAGVPNVEIPLTGDFDGDGKADPAVFRPSTAQWTTIDSAVGYQTFSFGQAGYAPSASMELSPTIANPAVSTSRAASPAAIVAQGPAESTTSTTPATPTSDAHPTGPRHRVRERRVVHAKRSDRVIQQKE